MPERSPDMQLEALDLGASLTVHDIQASLAWYRDVVGFAEARRFEREGKLFAVSLLAGSARVLITQDDGALGAARTKGEGFSLQLRTNQDVDALAAGIRARGGQLDSEPMDTRWGARMFRLRDPDGFRFVISSDNPS